MSLIKDIVIFVEGDKDKVSQPCHIQQSVAEGTISLLAKVGERWALLTLSYPEDGRLVTTIQNDRMEEAIAYNMIKPE
jgi:hypothetical protein